MEELVTVTLKFIGANKRNTNEIRTWTHSSGGLQRLVRTGLVLQSRLSRTYLSKGPQKLRVDLANVNANPRPVCSGDEQY